MTQNKNMFNPHFQEQINMNIRAKPHLNLQHDIKTI